MIETTRNEAMMDQNFFQLRYEVNVDAVAEAIIQRARLLRKLRKAAAAEDRPPAPPSPEVFVPRD